MQTSHLGWCRLAHVCAIVHPLKEKKNKTRWPQTIELWGHLDPKDLLNITQMQGASLFLLFNLIILINLSGMAKCGSHSRRAHTEQ